MAQTVNNQADPAEIQAARGMWHKFTKLITYSSIAGAVVLIVLVTLVY